MLIVVFMLVLSAVFGGYSAGRNQDTKSDTDVYKVAVAFAVIGTLGLLGLIIWAWFKWGPMFS
jgi:hypothetical protein